MPYFVHVYIGVVLTVAGAVGLLAAIVGRPVWRPAGAASDRFGRPLRIAVASFAGVAVITGGSVALGIVPPAGPSARQVDQRAVANPVATEEEVVPSPSAPAASPTEGAATGSPVVTAAPGHAPGSVSNIKVIFDQPNADCSSMKVRAVVTVTNPPVTVTYYAGATGVATGRGQRTITVSGTTATLAELTVEARITGNAWYEVSAPNHLVETRTWLFPDCVSKLTMAIASASFSGDCDGGTVTVNASGTFTGPSVGLSGMLYLRANSDIVVQRAAHFDAGTKTFTDHFALGPWPAGIERRIHLKYDFIDDRGLSHFGGDYYLTFLCGSLS